jgi:hypothetical protein
MTTYKELFGKYVQNYASDPTSTDAEGQIWYNTTSGTFKTALGSYGVWSAGGNYPISISSSAAAGTQTAAVAFGGYAPSVGDNTTTTAKYNGTTWTANPTGLGTARRTMAGIGIQTAALAAGGYTTTLSSAVESFNGTTWSPAPSLNTAGYYVAGAGTQTASIVFGRAGPTGQGNGATESYNGSSWTTVNAMVTARTQLAGFGIQTAAIATGGANPGAARTTTESWNGTSWTTVNSLNTGRSDLAGSGIQTAGLAFGGQNPGGPLTSTELWNGTSWTSNPTGLANGRYEIGGCGTQTASLAIGGNINPSNISNGSEEWTQSVIVPVAGSFSSGGNLNTSRAQLASAGIQTAAVAFGGISSAASESYNGTSWTTTPSMNTARRTLQGSAGTQTAALAFGGFPNSAATELYNGSSWTTVNSLNTSRHFLGGAGISTAALAILVKIQVVT